MHVQRWEEVRSASAAATAEHDLVEIVAEVVVASDGVGNDEAIEIIGLHLVDDKPLALHKPSAAAGALGTANRPLGNEDWAALGSEGVDLQLSGLFALVAPPFVAERARTRMPSQTRELRDQNVPPEIASVVGRVVTMFGIASPPAYVDPGQMAACTITLRAQGACWRRSS